MATPTTDRLWVCHRCELIGDGFEAGRHVDATGHPVEQLDQEASDAIRDIWAKVDNNFIAQFLWQVEDSGRVWGR